MSFRKRSAVALALAACLTGAAAAEPLAGTLFICGGAMSDENAVWEHFATMAGERGIAVIPTASGVPDSSGPGTAELFAPYHDTVHVADVTIHSAANAGDERLAALVRERGAVWFTGGDQRRLGTIYLNEDGTRQPVLDAVFDVLDGGGVIGGTSAGAACQSDPMLNGGSSEDSLLTGPDPAGDSGVGWQPGLGFFPWGLIDQHHIERGRMGRLLVALAETGTRFGYGIEEDSTFIVDRPTATASVFNGRVLMLDAGEVAGAAGEGYRGLVLRVLAEGDGIDLETGEVTIDSRRNQVPTDGLYVEKVEDVWGRGVQVDAFEGALARGAAQMILVDDQFRLTVSDMRVAHGSDGLAPTLVSGNLEIEVLAR